MNLSTGPRLLCATHVLPAPARAGNEQRVARLLHWLHASGWDLRLIVCPALPPTEAQMTAMAQLPYPVEVCPHEGVVPGLAERLGEDPLAPGRVASAADLRVAALVRGFCPDPLVARVAEIDAQWQPDVVLVEYLFLARCFPLLRPEVVKVIDTIDVFSAKASKVEALGVSDGYALDADQEAALLSAADLVVGIQPNEAAALKALVPSAVVISAGIDQQIPAGAPTWPPTLGVLIVASDNPMNQAGTRNFIFQAWPRVLAAQPSAQLYVVGGVCAALAADRAGSLRPPGVELVGVVDDLAGAYQAARVVVNPAAAGTGLKVKTLEGVAHGRLVVCWPAGVDGAPPEITARCTVVDTWPALADAVVQSLHRQLPELPPSARAALSPDRVYGRLEHTLRAMVAGRQPAAPRRSPRLGRRPRQLRLVSLYVQHGRRAYPNAAAELRGLIGRRLPGVRHDLIVLDNALPAWRRWPAALGLGPLPASNQSWEFSAWDDGVAQHRELLQRADAVALVTSAFLRYDALAHLGTLRPDHVLQARDERAVIGHVDHFNEPVWFDGVALQSWVRSSFLLLDPAELGRLGSLVSVGPDMPPRLFTDDPDQPFAQSAPLSQHYRQALTGWLTGAGTGQGVTWHSRFDLDAATMPRFHAKARAILNEQLLTHRLLVQGADLVPLNPAANWRDLSVSGRTAVPAKPHFSVFQCFQGSSSAAGGLPRGWRGI